MKYKILADRVKLMDSYLISRKKMGRELQSIRILHPSCPLWASHNLAYILGIRRSKTKDCDLNYTPKWYHNLAYGVVGTIALWVIN